MRLFSVRVNMHCVRTFGYVDHCHTELTLTHWVLRQNGSHFRRHFQMHFLEWKCMNFDKKNPLKFVPKGPINNIPALVQIMAWRRPGDKLLSEPMMVSLLTHICVTWLQWVKRHRHIFEFLLLFKNWNVAGNWHFSSWKTMTYIYYRKTSSISRTKSQNVDASCIVLRLSSLNPLKPGVKLRTKM